MLGHCSRPGTADGTGSPNSVSVADEGAYPLRMDSCSDAWLPTRMPGEMRGCQNGSHEREEKGKGEARGQLYEANRATVPHLVLSTGRRYRYLYDSYTITIPIHSTDSGVWNLPYKESRTRKEESVHVSSWSSAPRLGLVQCTYPSRYAWVDHRQCIIMHEKHVYPVPQTSHVSRTQQNKWQEHSSIHSLIHPPTNHQSSSIPSPFHARLDGISLRLARNNGSTTGALTILVTTCNLVERTWTT